jgi:tetratricopeptide (TPR) repeat protein
MIDMTLVLLAIVSNLNGQNRKIVNPYPNVDVNFYARQLQNAQKNLDQCRAETAETKNYIYELLSQTNDNELTEELNSYLIMLDENLNREFSSLSVIGDVKLKINNAIREYNNKIEKQNNPALYWEQALKFYEEGDIEKAYDNVNYVIELAADYPEGYLMRGHIYSYVEQYEDAINDFNKYEELSEKINADFYYKRGWAFYGIGNYETALKDFQMLNKLRPDASSYYSIGSCKSELGDFEGSVAAYKKAIEFEPEFSMAYNNLAWAYFKNKDLKLALTYADVAIDLDETNSVAFDTRGEIKYNLEDFNGAIIDFSSALEIDDKIKNSYLIRGKSYLKIKEMTKACDDWEKAGKLGVAEAYELISKYCK